MLKGILVGGAGGGGIQETCFDKTSFTNFITSQELMVARRDRPFQLVCSVCFSHLRPRDGSPENCFFQMSSVHVHPRAYVCIINENSQGEFPDLGKQNTQAKKVCCQFFLLFFWRAILKCRKESHTHTHTHTHKEK